MFLSSDSWYHEKLYFRAVSREYLKTVVVMGCSSRIEATGFKFPVNNTFHTAVLVQVVHLHGEVHNKSCAGLGVQKGRKKESGKNG